MTRVERLRHLVMCAYYIMQRKQSLISMRRHALLCMALDRAEEGQCNDGQCKQASVRLSVERG